MTNGTLQSTQQEELRYHRVSAHWLPRYLTTQHNKYFSKLLFSHLQRFKESNEFLESIVTDDKLAHHFTSLTK
ncbi:hypothetical protein Cfor_08335 [Coptotermes formosanus]|uniref:Uncharacterized protein n=1 Tax=Coptotermes formosanus TaxID=36987 RepID=A0A6L2Q3T3_COPFO|nr:hypothetical protein Cfor_08335 [Coptotermes formosanus]